MDFFTSFTIIVIFVLIAITIFIMFNTNKKHTRRIYVGGCAGTRYGCCPDEMTPKYDAYGSNCINDERVGGCAGTRYGCCDDKKTAKANPEGTNCSGYNEPNVGGCAGTRYGCCPDGKTARENPWGSNCRDIVERMSPNSRVDEFEHAPIDSYQGIENEAQMEPMPYSSAIFDNNVDI
jgi:hypothetical protein